MKKYKYSDKESKDAFSSLILRTVPDKDAKSYFEEAERDGTLSAKVGIINAEKTFQTLLKHSATDLDINKLGALTNGKTGNIYNITGFPQRLDLAERHIEQYGNWFSDGEVLGEGGNWGNLLKKETNILTVPSQSIIDMNNNSLKGFNIVIPNNSQEINANSINKYTNIKTDKNINMDVRTYVGQVYTKALHDEAIKLQKRDGGDLEVAMNKLQTQMQNDKDGNDALTKRIRKVIANSLGIVEETDKTTIKTTVTDTVAPEKTANEIEISKARKITVTHPEINNGVETEVALTEKNKKILDANNISYTVEQDTSVGDATIAEQVEQSKVKPKIKPADIGIKNQPVFESLESVQEILPNAMTGKEIKEKYEINFYLPEREVFQPSQFVEQRYR